MRMRVTVGVVLGTLLLCVPRPVAAQAVDQVQVLQQQIEQLRKDFTERLAALEAEIAALNAAQAALTTAAGPPNAKVFNPDIAVVGNFLGAAGRNVVNPSPALEMAATPPAQLESVPSAAIDASRTGPCCAWR